MTRRLAVIYEFPPAAHEYLSAQLLASAGIDRDKALICNLGDVDLKQKLVAWQPHFVLLFDRYGGCLKTFTGEKRSVDNYRGSLFMSNFTGTPVKCLATYHPQRIQLEYGLTGVTRFDIERVARELATDTLEVPTDRIEVELSKDALLFKLRHILAVFTHVAVDIEGYPHGISCIGFATGPNNAFVVPFIKHDNTSYWNEEDELELWQAVKDVLEAPHVSKIAHNALYELFCLAWAYGIVITGLDHDTMVMHFELYAEMPKDLGFCTSVYTKQPYYKSERKATDDRVLLLYNGKDCCRTYECWQAMTPKLMPKQCEHYEFNISLLVPLAYMSLRGIRYDKVAAERRLAEVRQQIYEKQDEINREASASRETLKQFYTAIGGCNGSLLDLFTTAFCKARRTEQREVEETTWQPYKWVAGKPKRMEKLDTRPACGLENEPLLETASTGRWVKANKQQAEIIAACAFLGTMHYIKTEKEPPAPGPEGGLCWLRPTIKTVTRNIPVTLTTFEDVQRFAKDSCASDCREAINLCKLDRGCFTGARAGQLATLLGIHVKINATNAEGDACWYLYQHCKFDMQFQKDGNKLTTRPSSDDEAIIKCWLQKRDLRALTMLRMRKLITESKFLKAAPDADGRIRFGLNLVGTPTGRMAAYGSPTGTSDVNPQTWPKKMRDLLSADEGCYIGNKDLAGSDGYSVAAYAAAQGDLTMLNDLKAGLKVAKIIALMIKHGIEVNQWSTEKLHEASKAVSEEAGPEYPTGKVVQHMSSYKGGPKKMSDKILMNSLKKGDGEPIHVSPEQCKQIQQACFFTRYNGVTRWHEWGARELKSKGMLVACNGFQRKFYGRKDDGTTLGEFLASMPQTITTYAILLTLKRQWNDPENRREDCSLRIEPLLLVHDSNVSQWKREDTEFAKRKWAEYFDNPVTVAGITFTIPASGSYGPNWKEQSYEL